MLVGITLPASAADGTRRIVAALLAPLGDAGAIQVVATGAAPAPVTVRLAASDAAAAAAALAAAEAAGAERSAPDRVRTPDGHVLAVEAPAGAAAPVAPAEDAAPVAVPSARPAGALRRVFATTSGVFVAAAADALPERFPIGLRDGDVPLLPATVAADVPLLAVTTDGRAFPVALDGLPEASAARIGARPLPLAAADRLAVLLPLDAPYVLLVTAGGEVKRAEVAPLRRLEPGEPLYDVPAGDRIVAAVAHDDGDDAILQARDGKALRLELRAIRPVKTPSAGGVAGMRLERGDEVVGATGTAGAELLVVLHRRGAGKAVPLADYPTKGRGTGGVQSSDPETPRRAPSGPVHGVVALARAERALVIGAHGSLLVARASAIPAGTRAAVAQHVARTEPGEVVVGAVRLPPPA